jgi:hypothetical protein
MSIGDLDVLLVLGAEGTCIPDPGCPEAPPFPPPDCDHPLVITPRKSNEKIAPAATVRNESPLLILIAHLVLRLSAATGLSFPIC